MCTFAWDLWITKNNLDSLFITDFMVCTDQLFSKCAMSLMILEDIRTSAYTLYKWSLCTANVTQLGLLWTICAVHVVNLTLSVIIKQNTHALLSRGLNNSQGN